MGRSIPRTAFGDGQATNSHLNARITATTCDVTLWLRQLENTEDIEFPERDQYNSTRRPGTSNVAEPFGIRRRPPGQLPYLQAPLSYCVPSLDFP